MSFSSGLPTETLPNKENRISFDSGLPTETLTRAGAGGEMPPVQGSSCRGAEPAQRGDGPIWGSLRTPDTGAFLLPGFSGHRRIKGSPFRSTGVECA